jgi:molybdenum cofactor biosynthesis enzyme MoaA
MDIYKILKINSLLKNHRIKFFVLWVFNMLEIRYLSLQFDPVLACNLKCQMCYFSDNEYVKNKMKGIFKIEEVEQLAKSIFYAGLKLQIGCGTEPTLYPNINEIICLAKKHKVPYISLTTNGMLLNEEKINLWVQSGLNEFTISMHGVHQESYEKFMTNANYKTFHQILEWISKVKENNSKVKLRINYTFNKDNFLELNDFFEIYGKYKIDIFQIRPIKLMGNTIYNDVDVSSLKNEFGKIIQKLKNYSKNNKITILCPNKLELNDNSAVNVIFPFTYCYISPKFVWRNNFNFKEESFYNWSDKHKHSNVLFTNIFKSFESIKKLNSNNSLNYEIELN